MHEIIKIHKKKSLGIFILVHHKPWLIQSSLLSLAQQTNKNFELNIVYIKGNGQGNKYEKFPEYTNIKSKHGVSNRMLSDDEPKIMDLFNKIKLKFRYFEYENDDGLDSGTWYKVIRDGLWREYQNVLFVMEGFQFTNETVINSLSNVIYSKNPSVIATGYEKRILSRNLVENLLLRSVNVNQIQLFHQKMINEVFLEFRKDDHFDCLYNNWDNDEHFKINKQGSTQYHVPMKAYNLSTQIKLLLINLKHSLGIYNPFSNLILVNEGKIIHFKALKKITQNYFEDNNIIYHKEKSPYFFSCGCQHLFSYNFLNQLDSKLKCLGLYDLLSYPFLATPLEIVWGFLPKWLGHDRYFFDGIHRPRKNFITNLREDDANGKYFSYLNKYSNNEITFYKRDKSIEIRGRKKRKDLILDTLGASILEL